jgi:hypothetical protein
MGSGIIRGVIILSENRRSYGNAARVADSVGYLAKLA